MNNRDAMGRKKAVWTKERRLKAAEHMRRINRLRKQGKIKPKKKLPQKTAPVTLVEAVAALKVKSDAMAEVIAILEEMLK